MTYYSHVYKASHTHLISHPIRPFSHAYQHTPSIDQTSSTFTPPPFLTKMPRTSRRHTPRLRSHRRRTRASRASRVLRMQRGGAPSKTRKINKYGGHGFSGCFTKPLPKQLRTPNKGEPQLKSIHTNASFQSQMQTILKTNRFEKGTTATHFKSFLGTFRASYMDSYEAIIKRTLSYANALQQNGFKIVRIRMQTGKALNSSNTQFMGSNSMGYIEFSEYSRAEAMTATPKLLRAHLWTTTQNLSMSNDTTNRRMISFENDPAHIVVSATDNAFTPFTQKVGSELLQSLLGTRRRINSVTSDNQYSVIWYYNKDKRNVICKAKH